MNSQSAQPAPAMSLYRPSNGPLAELARNPRVGDPPLSHDRSDGVA